MHSGPFQTFVCCSQCFARSSIFQHKYFFITSVAPVCPGDTGSVRELARMKEETKLCFPCRRGAAEKAWQK